MIDGYLLKNSGGKRSSSTTGMKRRSSLGNALSKWERRWFVVGEDGVLALLRPEDGVCAWRAQSREAALFDAAWCAELGGVALTCAGCARTYIC